MSIAMEISIWGSGSMISIMERGSIYGRMGKGMRGRCREEVKEGRASITMRMGGSIRVPG
jgi:hypothetical protein